VDVRQREEDREEKERCAVEEDAVAPHESMKDRRLLKCHELQERIASFEGIKAVEYYAAGRAQTEGKYDAVLDQRPRKRANMCGKAQEMAPFST